MKPSDYRFQFDLITKDRVFTLFASTKDEKRKWVMAINYVLTLKNQFDHKSKSCNPLDDLE